VVCLRVSPLPLDRSLFNEMITFLRARASVALCGVVALAAGLPAARGLEPYAHPTIAIQYAATKPVVDGTVGDAEWQGAFSQRALQATS
jgi:hypothetical protein